MTGAVWCCAVLCCVTLLAGLNGRNPCMRPCRWQSRGSSLVLYVKTPVDVEERQLTLQVGHLRHVCLLCLLCLLCLSRCMRVLS